MPYSRGDSSKRWELQLEDVDQQLQSPLYDGTIPPDIRKTIFGYAMAEYVDSNSIYPTTEEHSRPNFLGTKYVSINLLLMCKRSYLETRHLPPVNKTHVFWHGGSTAPPGQRYSDNERGYFQRFHSAQIALVQKIHLFTQQWWLEGHFEFLCRENALQGIEKLKITIRRGDWWWNERHAPLAITPQRKGADERWMKEDWRRQKAGEVVEWDPSCWGSAFMNLKNLKELEMEFEAYEYKEKELDEIAGHALLWKFPMGNGKVLSADGLGGVSKSSWRGPPCAWHRCPKHVEPSQECKFCEEKREGKGPILIIRILRWKLADAT